MTSHREVTACRLCDSANLSEVLNLGATPLANELDGTDLFPLVVNRCGSCGHHQLSIAVSPERLWGPKYPYASGTSPVFRTHLEKLADEVAALKPGGTVMEIASNDGTLVRMLLERKMLAWGVDPSGPHEGTLLRESWPRKRTPIDAELDVILALNVFAHVDDLHGFAAAVKEALAPDGVFILEVGYARDVIEKGVFDVVYHEHMSYHTVMPLWRFFQRHGLQIVETRHVKSQGGSIRCYVKHSGTGELAANWTDTDQDMGRLRDKIDSRSNALRTALNTLFHRGEMVCIYGAPAKLTTLLYATGLEKMPFNCVGDDNPRKVGRTTPGNHIPIVSVEEMLARKPDTIMIAAWNFADDLTKKLRGMGFTGGIINPMAGE